MLKKLENAIKALRKCGYEFEVADSSLCIQRADTAYSEVYLMTKGMYHVDLSKIGGPASNFSLNENKGSLRHATICKLSISPVNGKITIRSNPDPELKKLAILFKEALGSKCLLEKDIDALLHCWEDRYPGANIIQGTL